MSTRLIYCLGLIVIGLLLITSIYFQFFAGILPCPLCILQRFTFSLLGILFAFGILTHARRIACIIIAILCTLTSSLGIVLAARQIWLQHFSTNNTECGVSFQYMIKVLPIHQVLQKIFEGSSECTQRGWEFLSLNMAEWSLLWFTFFLLISLYLLFVRRGKVSSK